MTKQLGNSGRGTNGPTPRMNDTERRRSADASQGEQLPKQKRRTGSLNDAAVRPPEHDHDAAQEHPGGGRRSESEKPDSPDSRWGGGR